ncbi:MAG: cadmium resistance transporter [Cyanomargarita calcarea GSE-NOS-MK-12-04C]|jgi:cadmium resistance protein CadD (predicted permease)|uniref:Cadmium resistance transporter n=1 Tax=Cyanomargarita calcarea GSE-NOS-MK-12-04C TaxID=2839659 RepID=A0A951QSM9_9CYAN|nr:cadmium resistance transporter [Cyanomargarita calcarea GSE-NOS-MK-12-04C]
MLPQDWIGMLGIAPIAIGINQLLNRENDGEDIQQINQNSNSTWISFLSPQTYGVASVTFANGGDNLGIYIPLFANCSSESLLVILGVFFSMVGVLCYSAYRLISVPVVADTLTCYGNYLVPFVLIGLGIMILTDSHTLENSGLTVLTLVISCLYLLILGFNSSAFKATFRVEKNY